ncbi:MAG TPA: MFS transporter, partial [Arthrobacter sp.]
FMVSAVVGLVALVAILFIKEEPLRRTVDIVAPAAKRDGGPATGSPAAPSALAPSPAAPSATTQFAPAPAAGTAVDSAAPASAASAGPVAGTGIVDLDREFVDVLSQQRESQRRAH